MYVSSSESASGTSEVKTIVAIVLAAIVAIGMIVILYVLPSMNWSAMATPGRIETKVLGYILSRWIRSHADEQPNPFRATAENLKKGESDFNEHCSSCHGLDGSGQNQMEADFYPPIPKLTPDTQKWSDAELHFIISNGISMTAMPGFGKKHDAKEIWGMVIWIRHLGQLNPDERATLKSHMNMTTKEHEQMMEHSHPEPPDLPRSPSRMPGME